jgi:uncharacterized protein YunC (DUF1805 family)
VITNEIIETEKGAALGIMIDLDYRPPSLIIIQGEQGYLACGYISKEAVAKTDDSAAIITGVNSFEEMLDGKVVWASKRAQAIGVKVGMTGRQALEKLV